MKQVVIITRKLFDNDKVISRVVTVPDTYDHTDTPAVTAYAQRVTDDEHRRMAEQFGEFTNAEWTFQVMPLNNY